MPLDHYLTLGRSGLRVSPLCLGTMTFGEDWGWGSTVAESDAILRRFLDRVYYDMRNLGVLSADRALNYAATNAFQAAIVFSDVLAEHGTRGFRLLHKPYSIEELARALEGVTG
mgnify:CR=1 FL=1